MPLLLQDASEKSRNDKPLSGLAKECGGGMEMKLQNQLALILESSPLEVLVLLQNRGTFSYC